MNLVIYQGPSEAPWDITDHVPQDSVSLLQAELAENGLLKASLTLELYSRDENERTSSDWRARLRRPGILVIRSGDDFCFALYYNPVRMEYDPATRRYRLKFTSLLDGLVAYRSRKRWWNVLDAANLIATFRDFLSQYLPASIVNCTTWHPHCMSPMQEDPVNPEWPHFAGFIQPVSWLVGKSVDYGTAGPWTIINVLGIARSLAQKDTVFALCLAKPQAWWSNQGDYVLPIVAKAVWNPDSWDWETEGMFWAYDPEDEAKTWWWPVWFGMKKNLGGETGDSALIYTVNAPGGERVVCAWTESPVRKPGRGNDENDYLIYCNLRCVILDGDLNLLDQERISLSEYPVPGYTTNASPQTIILRGGGYARGTNMAPAGVVFVGVNGVMAYNPGGGGIPNYGERGQDGLCGVWALRWSGNAWTDSELQRIFADTWALNQTDPAHPERLLDYEIFPTGDEGVWQIIATRGIDLDWENLTLRQLNLALWTYDAVSNSATPKGGKSWELTYKDAMNPSVVFAVPTGPAYWDGEYYRAGMIFGYVIIKPGGGEIGHDGVFVSATGGTLSGPPMIAHAVNPDGDGYIETDLPLDAGAGERYDPHVFQNPGHEWSENETQEALASYLRTLIACRMRPFALRYEINGDTRRVKLLMALNSFNKYEVFALCADYHPVESQTGVFSMYGRELIGELVPKTLGGDFNEAETWRPLLPYPTLFANYGDPRSGGYDHQGNFGIFDQPVGWVSLPVTRKVCENDRIYSDMGRLGYQNMMNPDYRYWWNIYNAQRGHLVSTMSWWSLVKDDLDYRKGTNLELIGKSWDSTVHGLSYVAEKLSIHGATANRICLVLAPRFPIRGDRHTVSSESYWEFGKSSIYSDLASQVVEHGFSSGFMGRYWDSLFLGPQAGAILVNVWWDEEAQMESELLVSVAELSPQWFGAASWRGGLYTDLLKYLREKEFALGGLNARLGLRELIIPVHAWLNPVRIGSLINQDLMEDLEKLGDGELTRYRDERGEPIPMFWQIVGLRWDITRNRAVFRLTETRDGQWTPAGVPCPARIHK
ncbi:MAG: hypothetical protein ABIN58_00840 [candidate division WOR-3 bacterium]